MNFSICFKAKSWQSILAADVDAAIKRGIGSAGEERRIKLIDCEASLEHMLLSIGARDGGHLSRMKHLITGASARLKLQAAPDIRFEAGVSQFWQKRQGSAPVPADTLAAARRHVRPKEGTGGEA